jgi:hypothetical protein
MDTKTLPPEPLLQSDPAPKDALGIVIADGGLGARLGLRTPLVRAFIYGEAPQTSPTLPFGRWKGA